MRSPTRRSEKQVAPNYFFYMHIASCAAAPSPNFYKLRIKIVRSALMGEGSSPTSGEACFARGRVAAKNSKECPNGHYLPLRAREAS